MKSHQGDKNWKPEGSLDTPFRRAKQEWDDRMGGTLVQAKNWRLMSFLMLLFCFAALGGIIFLGLQPKQIPHIIEVNADGSSRYVGAVSKSWDNWSPAAVNLKFHLRRFVVDTREIIADPVVMKQRWFSAYKLVTPEASRMLSTWVQNNDPFTRMKKELVGVGEIYMVQMSKNTWQVDWSETVRNRKGNQVGSPAKWRGVFTMKFEQPKTKELMEANPIGLYISEFHWAASN